MSLPHVALPRPRCSDVVSCNFFQSSSRGLSVTRTTCRCTVPDWSSNSSPTCFTWLAASTPFMRPMSKPPFTSATAGHYSPRWNSPLDCTSVLTRPWTPWFLSSLPTSPTISPSPCLASTPHNHSLPNYHCRCLFQRCPCPFSRSTPTTSTPWRFSLSCAAFDGMWFWCKPSLVPVRWFVSSCCLKWPMEWCVRLLPNRSN